MPTIVRTAVPLEFSEDLLAQFKNAPTKDVSDDVDNDKEGGDDGDAANVDLPPSKGDLSDHDKAPEGIDAKNLGMNKEGPRTEAVGCKSGGSNISNDRMEDDATNVGMDNEEPRTEAVGGNFGGRDITTTGIPNLGNTCYGSSAVQFLRCVLRVRGNEGGNEVVPASDRTRRRAAFLEALSILDRDDTVSLRRRVQRFQAILEEPGNYEDPVLFPWDKEESILRPQQDACEM